MKTGLLLPTTLLLLLSCPQVNAQQWCPPGAVWYYGANPCMGACPGYVRMESAGDTMVADQPCTRIGLTRSYDYLIDGTYYTEVLPDLYTYAAQGIVWMFDPEANAFDTLYDFNAAPGDTWQLLPMPGPPICSTSSYLAVVDTGTMVVGGMALKRLSVQVNFIQEWGPDTTRYADTLVERIGSLLTYMLPHDPCNSTLDWQEGGNFRCYSDNDLSYESVFAPACDFIVGIGAHALRQQIDVFPNPGTDLLHIETGTMGRMDVQLRDATGRAVLTASAPGGSLEISSAGLSPGIYLIEVNTAEGRRTLKWLKR